MAVDGGGARRVFISWAVRRDWGRPKSASPVTPAQLGCAGVERLEVLLEVSELDELRLVLLGGRHEHAEDVAHEGGARFRHGVQEQGCRERDLRETRGFSIEGVGLQSDDRHGLGWLLDDSRCRARL